MTSKHKFITTTSAIACVVATSFAAAGGSLAQDGQGDNASPDTIIVTAQKREQNLQQVPLSVDALTSEQIEARNITSVSSLSEGAIANFNFDFVGASGDANLIAVRGVGSGLSSSSPRVGFFVDDVPFSDRTSLVLDLFELEQIEILRGPQSTLYGLAAEGGVINVKSRKPGEDYYAAANASYNSINDFQTSASVMGPVSDFLSLGVSAAYRGTDGNVENVLLDTEQDEGDSFGLRGQAVITPIDNLNIHLSAAYTEIDDETGNPRVPVRVNEYNADPRFAGTPLDEFETATDVIGFSTVEQAIFSGRFEYETDFMSVVGIAAHRENEVTASADPNDAPGPFQLNPALVGFDLGIEKEIEETYFELRFVSNNNGPFDWILGASHQMLDETEVVRVNQANEVVIFPDFPDFSAFPPPFQPLLSALIQSPTGLVNLQNSREDSKRTGVFGQASVRLLDERVGVTGGLRYDHNEVDDSLISFDTGEAVFTTSDSEDIVLWQTSLDWRVTDDVLAYGSVSTGWLPGGFNVDTSTEFTREEAISYELGLKTTLLDGTLRANAAIFQTEIEDYQEFFQIDPSTGFLGNPGDARFRGFELDIDWTPTDDWLFTADIGYTNAEYTAIADTVFAGFGSPCVGCRVPGQPEITYALRGRRDFGEHFFASAEFIGSGSFLESQDRSNDNGEIDGSNVVNIQVGYEHERISVIVFANNLTDEYYFASAINPNVTDVNQSAEFAGNPILRGIPGDPRHVGVRLRLRY